MLMRIYNVKLEKTICLALKHVVNTCLLQPTCLNLKIEGLLASFLNHRIGTRATMLIGSVLTSLGFMLTYFATSIWMTFFFFGIMAGTHSLNVKVKLYM